MHWILALLSILLCAFPAWAGENVEYKDADGVVLEGYWQPSTCKNVKATVLIAHQWMGITEYEQTRADMLAKRCYNAFVADIYGKGVHPKDVKEAASTSSIYKDNTALARTRMNAALNKVKTMEGVDPGQIHAMGYCFGGTMALELARSGANVASIHSFHGGLGSKNPATKLIRPPVIIHHGAVDPLVPNTEVAAFVAEMAKAEANITFYQYPNAVHAFTQPSAGDDPEKGVAYNAQADQLSWERLTGYLAKASVK